MSSNKFLTHSEKRFRLYLPLVIALLAVSEKNSISQRYGSKYPVGIIPAELKANAHKVVRTSERVIAFNSPIDASIQTTLILTILNENAIQDAILVIPYDKFSRVHNISGTIYNEAGEKVEQVSGDKILDVSAISNISLFDDNRVKYFEPKYRTCPFTVEYHYEQKLNGFLDLPDWTPIEDFHTSVQSASFTLKVKNQGSVKYKPLNLQAEPDYSFDKAYHSLTWKLENLKAYLQEPFSPSLSDYSPTLLVTPLAFNLNNHPGSTETWQHFGQWIYQINKTQTTLPETTLRQITDLVKDCPSDYAKAKKLYEFLQQKTRYVSIQIGIGAWKPIAASEVDRLGYGDCKALTNYFQALLAAVGIPSVYTLVLAGDDAGPVLPDFAGTQFNHAFLCIPFGQDTTWVECTNQRIPFGYIGSFTDDRYVLLVDENKSRLTHSHAYSLDENRVNSRATLLLDEAGEATIKSCKSSSGIFFSERLQLMYLDQELQKKILYKDLNLPGISLLSYAFGREEKSGPEFTEILEWKVPSYASITGSRMLVSFNRLVQPAQTLRKLVERKSNITIRRPYALADTVQLTLPPGYSVESLPEPAIKSSPFGHASYEYLLNGNTITFIRNLTIFKGVYPANSYPTMVSFFNSITFQDGVKLWLIRAAP